jgi:Ser/Thr protein kinase RdoA (MazF antagonist)
MHAPYFPVVHSILSPDALLPYVQQRYDIGEASECRVLNVGLNDTYMLQTSSGRYVLRVYRLHWRTLSDILYELDMLLHLHRKGVSVAYPIAMKDGGLLSSLNALEGTRQAVLLAYAEGEEPSEDEACCLAYGRAVAQVHNALADFSSPHQRFLLDFDHLLTEPLRSTLPLLEQRPEDQAYLSSLASMLKERVSSLPVGDLEWAACHGDFHGGNAHITADQQVTFFDFDCCGSGWRAYDIAVYRWAQEDDKLWEAFLEGYTQLRAIAPIDLAAIPLFVAIRQFWLVGLHASLAASYGDAYMNGRYFDRHVNFLKKWVAQHIDETAS